ncbi:ribbon-helix-helix CopG family protein [Haloferax elongans ATCC BAA-1513]|uniref:Ribbon-helix-helix CopG family protein n=2 Tax=Haloferax elongans TaxID=403191 RepID=M0HV19_HALEO|nr:ribbon-helix-helix CopG family protein [Haloferax elongans ATCC BAA-1513]
MVRKIDEQSKNLGMSRAEYVRHLIQQAPDSPFEDPDVRLNQSPRVDA